MESQAPDTVDRLASVNRRFLTFIIDMSIYDLGMILLINPLLRRIFGNSLQASFWNNYLFGLFMLFIYYFAFETLFQRTPGKFITGTRVIMEDGLKPDIGTIVNRTLIRFIPFEALSMYTGQVSIKKATWWHDRWSSTIVVRKTTDNEIKTNDNPILVVPTIEPAVRNNGTRLLHKIGVILLGFTTFASGGTLILLLLNLLRFGMRLTGNFWEDIFPFIILMAIMGFGLFGIVKLSQVLQKKM